MRNNIISAPLRSNSCPDFPVVQYADDTILVLTADITQVNQIRNLLLHFTTKTGLKVNYHKSVIIPINVSAAKLEIIKSTLGCQLGSFPFTYLGLPLSTHKLTIEDFTAMMQRIERRISGCSTLISYDARLQLIKSVYSSLPTYFMCCLALPLGVEEQINKYLKHCLCRNFGSEEMGTTMIAWDLVCKPKTQGGLGVLDLVNQNSFTSHESS